MDGRCEEMEDLEKRYQQITWSKVNDLIGKKKRNKNNAIKKDSGSIAMDIEDVKARWKKNMWQSSIMMTDQK